MDMIYKYALLLVVIPTTMKAVEEDLRQKCMHCYGAKSIEECVGDRFCDDSQRCIIRVLHHDNGTILINSGCVPKDLCDGDVLTSPSLYPNYHQVCGKCCMGKDCNRVVCNSDISNYKKTLSPPTATTPTATLTPSKTTSTTTTTTTPTSHRTTATITTKEPTTKKSLVHVKTPAKCEVCSGPLCGMISTNPVACPRSAPYCMNVIENSEIGDRTYTKQCATRNECQRRWWEGSSDQPNCVNFNVRDFYYFRFTCVYCCVKDGCNTDVFPARATLFKGSS